MTLLYKATIRGGSEVHTLRGFDSRDALQRSVSATLARQEHVSDVEIESYEEKEEKLPRPSDFSSK